MNMTAKLTKTFFIILILIPAFTYAQTEKGNILLGGGIDLSNTTYERESFSNQETFSLNFNPKLSYFILDNLALGITLPISYSKQNSNNNDNKTTSISIGPALRYYFTFDRLAIFPELRYSAGGGNLDGPYFDISQGNVVSGTIKFKQSNFNAGLGLAYFLNKNIAFETILSYNKIKTEYDNDSYSDLETSSLGLDIGFQIYLQTKKD